MENNKSGELTIYEHTLKETTYEITPYIVVKKTAKYYWVKSGLEDTEIEKIPIWSMDKVFGGSVYQSYTWKYTKDNQFCELKETLQNTINNTIRGLIRELQSLNEANIALFKTTIPQ